MNREIRKETSAYKVEIFIGGDYKKAAYLCGLFCTSIGLCVTIEPTIYVYRGGACDGVRIGIINYARFPKPSSEIWFLACDLASLLKQYLDQGSYTVQDHEDSLFVSTRDEDQ